MSGTIIPVVIGPAGYTPQSPVSLKNQLLTLVAAQQPGYTANLPGLLIEDISSTEVGALTLMDSALGDLINSLTPYGVNQFLLTQLGNVYGVSQEPASNTSVYVVFSGTVGYPINVGFTVGDGTYQYTVQDGGVILSGGSSALLYCLATTSGTWAVPPNTVTTISTSVPTGISLTVTNPSAGVPGGAAETSTAYRVRVLQMGLASAQGMPRYLRANLEAVSGVSPRLISIQQQSPGWKVICGGGDPYAVANAILNSLFDVSQLVGSVMVIESVTQAANGVVTTLLNHGYSTGQVITISGALGMTELNTGSFTITVLTPTTFELNVNTSGYPAYTSGGVCSPNSRNITVSINQYPDTYSILFVNPPQQTVTMAVTWSTSGSNYVSAVSIALAADWPRA